MRKPCSYRIPRRCYAHPSKVICPVTCAQQLSNKAGLPRLVSNRSKFLKYQLLARKAASACISHAQADCAFLPLEPWLHYCKCNPADGNDKPSQIGPVRQPDDGVLLRASRGIQDVAVERP